METLSYTCRGPGGPQVRARGPRKRHPAEVVGRLKKASPTMLVDTASKSRNSCCSLRWEYPWVCAPIYRTRRNRAGKMRNRGGKAKETNGKKIGGGPRSRKRKRHWPPTGLEDSKLAPTKGRGRPRSQKQTSWWLLPNQWRGQSTQKRERREEK